MTPLATNPRPDVEGTRSSQDWVCGRFAKSGAPNMDPNEKDPSYKDPKIRPPLFETPIFPPPNQGATFRLAIAM